MKPLDVSYQGRSTQVQPDGSEVDCVAVLVYYPADVGLDLAKHRTERQSKGRDMLADCCRPTVHAVADEIRKARGE